MGAILNLAGEKFGRLTVIEKSQSKGKNSSWICTCDCGNEKEVLGFCLKNGNTKSCGCLLSETVTARRITHSHTKSKKSPEYTVWDSMIQRCTNPNHSNYEDYGGRGIYIDPAWINSFEKFYEDMGQRPSLQYSIDRRNVNGTYCKENCSWEDRFTQARNTRMRKTNTTGVRGVHLDKRRNTYTVSICCRGIKEEKSGFKTITDAEEYRKNLEIKYWGKESS